MKRLGLGRRVVWLTHHWRHLYIAKSRHFWLSLRRYPGVIVINFVGFEVAALASGGDHD
jgi:hypothetical protein